jgi:hypothetical protein
MDDVMVFHDYTPFNTPRTSKAAKNGYILGAGTLEFSTMTNGTQTTGNLRGVYYIQDIYMRLISLGKLFAKGWDPRLSRGEITLYDESGKVIFHALMKDDAYPAMLRAMYPDDIPYLWDIPGPRVVPLVAHSCHDPHKVC